MLGNNPADLKTPTKPEDCGLAIALPLTKEDVWKDYQENAAFHDYIPRHVKNGYWYEYWQEWIQPIAEVCSELVSVAEDLGVNVKKAATLAELKVLFQSCSVVTIVAHWRGSRLFPSDLLASPKSFASTILDSPDEISSTLRSRINLSDLKQMLSNSDSEEDAEQLVKLLNNVIESPSSLITLKPHSKITVVLDDLDLSATNRNLLDQWASQKIKPGNRLELRDGLHSPAQVAQIIPNLFAGIIDFAMCHSTVLGNLLRKGKPNRRIIINARKIQPVPRCLMLKLLYEQLSKGHYNYGRLLHTIYAQLLDD